jgi:hypothetical protein
MIPRGLIDVIKAVPWIRMAINISIKKIERHGQKQACTTEQLFWNKTYQMSIVAQQ